MNADEERFPDGQVLGCSTFTPQGQTFQLLSIGSSAHFHPLSLGATETLSQEVNIMILYHGSVNFLPSLKWHKIPACSAERKVF
jgi:diphthamide synthase subunit DPH2